MAVAPLFHTDMDALLNGLRMKGITQEGTLAVVQTAVREVRVGFYDRLGSNLITDLLATSDPDNPTSDDEVNRARATIIEHKWVKYVLMRDLPVLFMDGSNNVQQDWNEDGLVRTLSASEIAKMAAQLWAEIEAGLNSLISGEPPSNAQVLLVQNDDFDTNPPPRPRDYIFHPDGGII